MRRFNIILICFLKASFLLQAQEAEKNIKAGNDLYKKQQFEKATKEYEKIPEWDSSYAIAQYNLSNALYKSGKKDEANKTINILLKNNKDATESSRLYYNKAVILGSQKKLEESIEEYKNALRKSPDDKDARENLQKALLELKKKSPPPKKEDKQKKPQQSKMNQKEAMQKLKELEQKEKKVQQKIQNTKTSSGSQKKDW